MPSEPIVVSPFRLRLCPEALRPKVTREELEYLISLLRMIDLAKAEFDERLQSMLSRLTDAPELRDAAYPEAITEILRLLAKTAQ